MSVKKIILVRSLILLLIITVFFVFYLIYKAGTDKIGPQNRSGISRPENSVYPSQILDLNSWKLTIPEKADNSDLPVDILRPELDQFQLRPWFMSAEDKKGVIFRAPVNAPTTANTSYPRSELREMTDDGKKEAFWPTKVGTHTLVLDQAITATPQKRPIVVAGQIHGDDDDLVVIRLEDKKLFISRSRTNLATLDDNYILEKRFTIKFVAENGEIKVYYNNNIVPSYTLRKKVEQAYFKAGVYTQSNCETEESADLCNDNNYGEVIIYKITLSHQQ